MQHQYWITKQTLSRKLGRKEDECIVSSDAQLDAKLELFRNIQISCTLIQRIINKYQESICYLSQEINSMGKFLKENTNEDKTHDEDVMLTIGKSLIFCAQQQLILHEPLIRFYQELETFRQRAVGDTLQNVLAMEKARTEYRAALSWMKNVSQQLDPDTIKQLEKFKRVQQQVRRGKMNFDKQSLDCLQKIDLLAAARCNMFNHALSLYQNKLINYIEKSAGTYSTILETFEYQYRNQICEENDVEISSSQFSEKATSFVQNIGKEINVIEESNSKNTTSSTELNDQRDRYTSLLQFCDYQTSKVLSKSHKYNDKLDSLSKSEYKNNFNEVSNIEKSKCFDIFKNDCNIEGDNTFLPPELLKQSLESAITKSEIQNSMIFTDKNNMNLSKKSDNARTWINFFEELDPLSNSLNEKYKKHKGSFV